MVFKISNLTKSYAKPVLQGISLSAGIGGVLAIVGPSGSGKTTLLKCIANLEDYEGSVECSGRVGMVFQDFNLWPHKTVLENVAEAPRFVRGLGKQAAMDYALEYLDFVGLSQKSSAYPHTLSGGETQRAAIARTLAMKPSVLLLDEVTSNLDLENKHEVAGVLKKLRSTDAIIVVVTHDLDLVKLLADRVLFLEAGKIIADEPVAGFFASKNERIQRFLGKQV